MLCLGHARQRSGVRCRTNIGHRDPLYLFVCHLEWHKRRSLTAYQELLAALDDNDCNIRNVAEALLHRSSPRLEPAGSSVEVL